MEEKILTQTIPTPAAIESTGTLPPAQTLLPKPLESQTPYQFKTVPNKPGEQRRKRPGPDDSRQQPGPNNLPTKPVPSLHFITKGKGPRKHPLLKLQRSEHMSERQPVTFVSTASSQKQRNMGMAFIPEN